MKEYFKRLKEHPGLGAATLMTIMFVFAGMSNKSIEKPIDGAIFGLLCSSVVWVTVLISNIKRK